MSTRLLLDGTNIETLLHKVRSDYGQHARIVHAEKVRSGGIGGFFSKERYEVAVEVDDAYVSMPRTSTATPVAGGQDQPLALLLAEAMNQVGGEVIRPLDPKPTPSTSRAAFADVLGGLSGLGEKASSNPRADLRTHYDFAQSPAPTANSHAVIATYGASAPVSGSVAPPAAVAEIENSPVWRPVPSPQPIRDDIKSNPPRPPRGPGQVLAVVGEVAVAFNTCVELARRMRISPNRVLLASPDPAIPGLLASRRLTDSLNARKRSVKLLSETMPSVIAVDLPIGAIWDEEAVDWAREMVTAVGAVQVWAVVDATRKQSDLSRWLSRLGPVDALVVYNAAITEDLNPILNLGYPVALLDARPATTSVWQSMLRGIDGHDS